MKALVMPSATVLRTHGTNVDHIVSIVLKMRSEIEAKRKQVIAIPSVMRAEFTRELEKAD
jgi:hypothetical protein